jgi:ferric-dicitrate binding protein FerR (iron transport regulator)
MNDRLLDLASRYLDGEESVAGELKEILHGDPAARRTFARLLRQHSALRRLHTPPVPSAAPRPRWSPAAAAAACLVVAVGAAWLLRGGGAPASVVEAENSVWVDRGGKEFPALRGTELRAGDVVRTDDSSAARLRYAGEATTVVLRGGTRLRLAASESGKRLEILEGTIEADVAPQPAGRPMILASPQAEVSVVGTLFTVAAAPDRTRVEVDKGAVRVTGLAGKKEVDVAAGSFVVAESGVELKAWPMQNEFSEGLRNGGFESGDLAGWGDRENQRNRRLDVGVEFRHSGQFGARLVGPGGFDQRIRTVPGKTYYVGGWVRIEHVTTPPKWGGIRFGAYPEGAGQDRWKPIVYYPFVTTAKELPRIWAIVEPQAWHRARFSFVAKSAVTTIRLDHFTDGRLETWADDLVVSPDPLPE